MAGIEEAATSKDSSVLATGNPAALSRLTTLEASRAASSVFDQGAQDFFGRPALGLRGEQDLGCGAPDRGELEPPQPGIEISRQYAEPIAVQRVWLSSLAWWS